MSLLGNLPHSFYKLFGERTYLPSLNTVTFKYLSNLIFLFLKKNIFVFKKEILSLLSCVLVGNIIYWPSN